MASLNRVCLLGRIGKDPEEKFLPSGSKVANFSIATSEKWKDKSSGEMKESTDWHNCIAYDPIASVILAHTGKGDLIYVEGKLETKTHEKNGEKRYFTQIKINLVNLLPNGEHAPKRDVKKDAAGDKKEFDAGFDDDIPF